MVNSGVRTLYNILFTICFILSAPYYFLRMRRRGNWQRSSSICHTETGGAIRFTRWRRQD